jgi:nitroreductase
MDALEAITARQGVLRYRTDPVPAGHVDAVLAAAVAAPSPVNLQPWAFVVVTEPERVAQVTQYLVHVQEARVFDELLEMPQDYTRRLIGLYDEFRPPCFIFVCLEPKVDFAKPEHQDVMRQWCLVSLGAAMTNLMVAATSLGLGTRWFGGFALEDAGSNLKAMLGIPKGVEVIGATPLGYHDEAPKPRPLQERATIAGFKRGDSKALGQLLRGKLPLDEVVHREQW